MFVIINPHVYKNLKKLVHVDWYSNIIQIWWFKQWQHIGSSHILNIWWWLLLLLQQRSGNLWWPCDVDSQSGCGRTTGRTARAPSSPSCAALWNKKQAVSPDHQKPAAQHIYRQMYLVHLSSIRSTCILSFSRSRFFWLSRCPSHTWAHIKYPSSLCLCTRVYKHTHAHHPNTRKNSQVYKTKPLSLPLQKHSLPRQQQALTMNKLKQTPLPIPPHTRMQVLGNTCDTRACSREIGQYK